MFFLISYIYKLYNYKIFLIICIKAPLTNSLNTALNIYLLPVRVSMVSKDKIVDNKLSFF
jgi:hypothetical protein